MGRLREEEAGPGVAEAMRAKTIPGEQATIQKSTTGKSAATLHTSGPDATAALRVETTRKNRQRQRGHGGPGDNDTGCDQ